MSADRPHIVAAALQAAVLLLALWLRWPWPEPGWSHIDEHIFIDRTLGFWGGDLNPHFFNYPTLQLYIASALQYLYYFSTSPLVREEFIALRYFVDGSDLLTLARAATTLMAVGTVAVTIRIGARLYGLRGGLSAGLLLALFPLHVRFSHLAATDVPAVFWLSLALLFSVRIVQEGQRRDYILAGLFTGLAAATKYPAALVCLAVVVATWRRPPKELWTAGAVGLGSCALASPYVLLDFAAFWQAFSSMGQEHLLGQIRDQSEHAGAYLLQYSLRYGIGLVGLAAVLGAIAYRPRAWRREEVVVLTVGAACTGLLLFSDSVFMRYAVPLAPVIALLCARLLAAQTPRVCALGLLLLAVEPLYASQQLRGLLSRPDTRMQAAAFLRDALPAGSRVFSVPSGLAPILHHHAVMGRQEAFLKSFGETALTRAYALLARRDDLPVLHGFWPDRQLGQLVAPEGAAAVDSAWVLHYTHPLLGADLQHPVLARAHWHAAFTPGPTADMVFDRVDRFYAPIGGFARAERTGPEIRIGKVPLTQTPPSMPQTNEFFAILHQLRRADRAAEHRDWRQVVEINTSLMRQFDSLRQMVAPSYLYKLCTDLGTAWDHLGDPQRSAHYHNQARLLLAQG